MKRKFYIVILTFAALVVYLALDNLMVEHPEVQLTQHDQLIMYSLTGCSSCEEKRGELQRANIPYVEYVVDRQQFASDELTGKLNQAGFSVGGTGFPSFDVKGTLIPNNPPLFQIIKHMEKNET
ncbi:MAG: hypothetical protein L3J62_07410 [Gammaproteobacteria bacterium]|nr:hypothetical protein [Gammaproteobacteria bacterium]MCF6230603.1 hypothetical protein [Gammaproteobacteria bacterium]